MAIRFSKFLAVAFLLVSLGRADNAIWMGGEGNWTNSTMWSTNTDKMFPGTRTDNITVTENSIVTVGLDTATFNTGSGNVLIENGSLALDGIKFEAGTGVYDLSVKDTNVFITGDGVVNTSGVQQVFHIGRVETDSEGNETANYWGTLSFAGNATAGGEEYNIGSNNSGIMFLDNATAGNSVFYNEGTIMFGGNLLTNASVTTTVASAGNSVINNKGGKIEFYTNATAASATINAEGGIINFYGNATAANAVITGNTNMTATPGTVVTEGNVTNATLKHTFSAVTITFGENATAANATITVRGASGTDDDGKGNLTAVSGPSTLAFVGNASAGYATLNVIESNLTFSGYASGGMANVTMDKGNLTVATWTENFSVGSITGSGNLVIGGNATQEIILKGNDDMDWTEMVVSESSGVRGSITKEGAGDFTLGNLSTHTGNTTIRAGNLFLGGNMALATSVLVLENAAVLHFAENATAGNFTGDVFLGGLAGNASVEVADGVMMRTGNNSLTAVYEGVLSGTGNITKEGDSLWVLKGGDSSGFAGNTTVTGGRLGLSGTKLGGFVEAKGNTTVEVLANGVSHLDSLKMDAGAWLKAVDYDKDAHAFGTLEIEDFTAMSGAGIEIGAAKNGTITHGTVKVNGTVAIDAPMNVVIDISKSPEGFRKGNVIEDALILSGGNQALVGNQVKTQLDNVLVFDVTFNATTSSYSFTANQLSYTLFAKTKNQKAMARLMDAVSADNSAEVMGYGNPVVMALNNNVSGKMTGKALDQLSPATFGSMTGMAFDVMDTDVRTVEERVSNWRSDKGEAVSIQNMSGAVFSLNTDIGNFQTPVKALLASNGQGAAGLEPLQPNRDVMPWGVYAIETIGGGKAHNDGNTGGYSQTSGGFTAGVERRVGQDWVVGVQGGYTSARAEERQDDGEVKMKAYRGLVYAGWNGNKGAYAQAYGRVAKYDYETERNFNYGEYVDVTKGETNGHSYGAMVGGGYDWSLGEMKEWKTGPVGRLSYESLQIDGFTETAAIGKNTGALDGETALSVAKQTPDSLRTELGWHASWEAVDLVDNQVWMLDMRIGWVHEFRTSTPTIRASFAKYGSAGSVEVDGNELGKDRIRFGVGGRWYYSESVRFNLNCDLEAWKKRVNCVGSFGVTFRF